MEGDLSVFSAPTEMTFGPRASARAGGLARGLGAARMFAVTDRGVFEAEVLGPAQNPPLPVIAIPTTAGSGNEVSSWALPGRCPTAASPDEDVELIVRETLARPRPSLRPATAEDLRAIVLEALAG